MWRWCGRTIPLQGGDYLATILARNSPPGRGKRPKGRWGGYFLGEFNICKARI